MGIFNHFCDCCLEGIEGARFHCQLCENFDMCQSCFVSQGAIHIHGQQAFSCPELDELEQDDEGDEGDEIDFDVFSEYLASLGAEAGEEAAEDEDTSLDGFSFQFVEDDPAQPQESIRLADENGPLERITPEEMVDFEAENTPINLSKIAASEIKLKKSRKTKSAPPVQPMVTKKLKKKQSLPVQATLPEQNAKSPFESPILGETSPKTTMPRSPLGLKKSKNKKATNGASVVQPKKPKQVNTSAASTANEPTHRLSVVDEAEDEAPLRQMLEKILASHSGLSLESKKQLHKDSSSKVNPEGEGGLGTSAASPKKRARADGSAPKVKKQKLIPNA